MVPRLAISNRPSRFSVAPVKEPFSCPKNSLSIKVSEIAAQFTLMNGAAARPLARKISVATISFPVPFSPLISTVASVGATFWII